MKGFSARVTGWWTAILHDLSVHWQSDTIAAPPDADQSDPLSQHILVVTHGGVITTLVNTLVGGKLLRCASKVQLGKCFNASITVIEVPVGMQIRSDGSQDQVLVQYSDTSHLTGMKVVAKNADVVE